MDDDGDPPTLCPLCGQPAASSATSASSAASLQGVRPPLKRKGAPPEAPPAVVRVEIGDEAAALREALARQQAALGEVQAELDAERGAAAGAASEAMTMILRLQREKAEAMMEARQFRRYAEEKMSHDAAELAALEEALAKRDATLRAVQSRYGGGGGGGGSGGGGSAYGGNSSNPASSPHVCSTPRYPPTPTPAASVQGYYPALRCCIDHPPTSSEADALDAQTPRDHLSRLTQRVQMLERGAHPTATATTTPIIRVAPGSTFPRHADPRAFSDADSLDFGDGEFFADDVDCGASDRVYTVDAIHGRGGAPLAVPESSLYCGTPSGSECYGGGGGGRGYGGGGGGGAPWGDDDDMRRLRARLQALEADRETMRQAIVSMGAEKTLKEIAQQLYREGPPVPVPMGVTVGHHLYKGSNAPPAMTVTMPRPRPPVVVQRRMIVQRPPVVKPTLFATVAKWVTSIISWRRKTPRIKYPVGRCGNNVGLLLLLEKVPRAGHGHMQAGHMRLPKKI